MTSDRFMSRMPGQKGAPVGNPRPSPLRIPVFGIIWGMTKGDAILAVAMGKAVPPVARFMGTGERTRNARRRANPVQNGQDVGSPSTRTTLSPCGAGEQSA